MGTADDVNTGLSQVTAASAAGVGNYLFTNLAPGCYFVKFTTPAGFTPTVANSGSDTTDSDAVAGVTGPYVLVSGVPNLTVDAGFYVPPTCGVSLTKECAIVPPPPSQNYTCTKPIDSLSMRWTGASGVTVKAFKGAVGTTTLLGTKTNVQNGEIVTFTGFGGTPNDVQWGIYQADGTTLIGKSDFHISCSDGDMDGAEDCFKPQGDGKALSGSWIQTWNFEGMSGGGKTLTCTQNTALVWKNSCEITPQANPSCATEGAKPTSLTFKYIPADCSTNNNPQGGKYVCSGTTPAGPVTMSSTTSGLTFSKNPVAPGDEVTVSGSFGSQTVFNVGTQSISIHTSCSQVLEVGNIFASLEAGGVQRQAWRLAGCVSLRGDERVERHPELRPG